MLYTLEDVKVHWKEYGKVWDFQDYVHTWFVPTYDHAYNFVGYRRSR